jgi:hypothetical protein
MMNVSKLAPIVSLLCLGLNLPAMADALQPFGMGATVGAAKQAKAVVAKPMEIDCFSDSNTALWMVENPQSGATEKPFVIEKEGDKPVLRLKAGLMEPARTTVRILLPGDGPANGGVWAKGQNNYISFLCKSTKPAQLTFHLLQRGKTAGTCQAPFAANPGEWTRVILPVANFKLKGFGPVAGLAFRMAAPDKDAVISIKEIGVGGVSFTEDSWKSQRTSISIDGEWYFATDPGDQGMSEKWYADKFDASKWQTLKSGESWQKQGIEHYGYGWYRQQLFIPKEAAGIPLELTLCSIPSDDDTWFNGQRIGGFNGEYKYKNWYTRVYTVPPSLIRYGENNTIAIRIWGGHLTFVGNNSGLVKGPLVAELDPFLVQLREPGGKAVPYQLFDLSDAKQGKPFEIIFSFPADLKKSGGAVLKYKLTDFNSKEIKSGQTELTAATEKIAQATVAIDRETAQTIYLRGRFNANLMVEDATGGPLYSGTIELDRLSFAKRDNESLPMLPEQVEETPYGKLKLIDEIDATASLYDDPHPYLQGGFDHETSYMTPGAAVNIKISDVLGKKARECDYGWYAYRLGRGKLKPHTTYLVRIEYPEDQPRFAPIELQSGQNFTDVGWKNGVGTDDPYDNWPLSKKWQWYDVIFPLDDESVGTGGVGTASAENGFWIYFMNKMKPGQYYAMWSAGPAVGRIKLYEIDAEKNAPVIQKPKDLPHRVLGLDWERQPDSAPADFVRYAKLMGYSTISPIMLKWFFSNYSPALNGYSTVVIDDHSYWAHKDYQPGDTAASPIPSKKSQHELYLEATKQFGIDYVPRVEFGGSADLPKEAWAVDVAGQPTKPNRFAPWCADLLNPLTWEDMQKYVDHLYKPYVKDNPQLNGMLWRIRCNRMPISYTKADIALFAKETGLKLPAGGDAQAAAWAAGEMKGKYDDWWHQKRMEFHAKLAKLLQSYRSDMTLYYYNWDEDKFGLIQPDITSWAFVSNVVKPPPDGGRAAYEKERASRKALTAADYIEVMRTGNFGAASKGVNRADYGIRPQLYKDVKGMQIFAPANYLCYADKPEYLNYFQMPDGLAVSNVVSYDEIGARSINPKYEGNMITPAGGPFSMALELLSYFHGDARTLNYTVYTYGRGFADAHRRFAQAFLALPAIPGTVADQGDADLKVRTYPSANGTYVGVAFKGYAARKFTVKLPGVKGTVKNLVTNETVPSKTDGGALTFDVDSGPMELDAYLVQ